MIDWQWLAFNDIPGADLYAVLYQRQQVFVLEQQCLYPDIDGYDLDAHHLLGWRTVDGKRELAAYLRCLAPGAKYQEMSLGRVLTTEAARGLGIGRQLVERGIQLAEQLHPGHRFRIGAQARLEKFYASLGFETVTAPYDEDGIMHIDMVR
ncbi:MAG: GNAT family N-acetyltransferase [Pseudomonadota bacterium]